MSGPRLFGALALFQTALFMVALDGFGTQETGLAAMVRATARMSFAFFLPVYAASPLRRFWRHPTSAWLLRNRRQLGLAFAWAHGLHLLAIGMLALILGDAFRTNPVTLPITAGAYLLIAAMALSSNDWAVRRLGRKRWVALHRTGLHWVWGVFAFDWTAHALGDPLYWLAAAPAWAAAALRLAAWTRSRPHSAHDPAQPSEARAG